MGFHKQPTVKSAYAENIGRSVTQFTWEQGVLLTPFALPLVTFDNLLSRYGCGCGSWWIDLAEHSRSRF